MTERDLKDKWKWGTVAAALHFSTLNGQFMSLDDSAEEQLQNLQKIPQPELLKRHGSTGTALPAAGSAMKTSALLPTMLKRRTVRETLSRSISVQQLSDCLYSGLAITGTVRGPAGSLPLSITPSGGARNPYEAYVYVADVPGMVAGIYHYSGLEHSLQVTRTGRIPVPSQMLGGQEWVDNMPAIILLVAHLERTMWKYHDANAYRVTLIEAGHIGQNIMLAATAHGLSACPTAALHHETICDYLGLSEMLHVPIYALTLGHPQST